MDGYYSESYEIMSHDVDANNNARPSVVARLLQETANHHMRDRKPTYYELFYQGKSYILVRFACEVVKQLHPYDKVEVRTWTCEPKGATFKRNYTIHRNEEVVAKAYSEWAVVDIKTGRILKSDQVDHANYERGDQIELTIPAKYRIPKEMELEISGRKHVGYSDCDMNMHMNNTNYPDMLWNNVPDVDKKVMTGFSLHFMSEAHLGSEIEIRRGKLEEPITDGGRSSETWVFQSIVGERANVEGFLNTSDIAETDMWTY